MLERPSSPTFRSKYRKHVRSVNRFEVSQPDFAYTWGTSSYCLCWMVCSEHPLAASAIGG